MKSTVMANFDMTWLPISALIIFLIVFFSVLFLIFRKEAKTIYDEVELLPLRDENDSKKAWRV